ncbi:MAG: T9SS type A sorting domain-containing protein, partial [Candidatus Marinimicrobia bacterium]|nr:T9SS type A sorting domain-containing protein [Candidatus Neomarinimicrobiota bacterium]
DIQDNGKVFIALQNYNGSRITWVKFTAIDPQGTQDKVVVQFYIRDALPPNLEVWHVYNSVLPSRVMYLISGDKSVDGFERVFTEVDMNSGSSREVPLEFSNTEDKENVWYAFYKVTQGRMYTLKAAVEDNENNRIIVRDTLSVYSSDNTEIGKRNGNISYVLDKQSLNKNNPLFLNINSVFTEQITNDSQENEKVYREQKSYNLSTAELTESMLIIRKTAETREDLFYSFYNKTEQGEELIKTYYNKNSNEFQAFVEWNKPVLFKKSDQEAQKKTLDETELACYPNPFNHRLRIEWVTLIPVRAKISVYNILGQRVYRSNGKEFGPGINIFNWNAVNNSGMTVPSGIYFIRLENGRQNRLLKKVTLLK